MPLRGTVSDYGLADVLQLIAAGARSGRLVVERPSEGLDISLAAATVVDVRTGRPTDAALGARLVQAGLLTEDRLGWALAERAETGTSIGQLLSERGDVDPSTIAAQATLQRWDTLLAPFTWQEGRYSFREGEVTVTEGWAATIPVDQLIMRGLRLVADWPSAVTRVPSRRWVIARRLPLPPAPAEVDPFGGAFDLRSQQAAVSDEARAVHAIAAPGASVLTVVGRAPFDGYETTLALSELVEGGFLVLSPP
jgi:hypothetical protein